MSINAGSFLSTIITPILRGEHIVVVLHVTLYPVRSTVLITHTTPAGDVKCFGGDCYALAFGVPAALMVVALGEFSPQHLQSFLQVLFKQSKGFFNIAFLT